MSEQHAIVMELLDYQLHELEAARDELARRAHGETHPATRLRLQRRLACVSVAIDRKIQGEALAAQTINEMVTERIAR